LFVLSTFFMVCTAEASNMNTRVSKASRGIDMLGVRATWKRLAVEFRVACRLDRKNGSCTVFIYTTATFF
jgi:hypothetical protein